jgi:hypothetical protein
MLPNQSLDASGGIASEGEATEAMRALPQMLELSID